jgi:DNA-binding beta-propeller fold protein YncE
MMRVMPGRGSRFIFLALAASLAALGTAAVAVAKPGDIYLGDSSAGQVLHIDPATGVITPFSSGGDFAEPSGLEFGRDGVLYVADYDAFPPAELGAIFRVPATGGVPQLFAAGAPFDQPYRLDVGADGRAYVADVFADPGGNGGIFAASLGLISSLASGPPFEGGPTGISFAPDGKLYAVDQNGGDGGNPALFRIEKNGGKTLIAQGPANSSWSGLEVSPEGTGRYLYTAQTTPGGDAIVRVDMRTRAPETVFDSLRFDTPLDLDLAPDGSILVANSGDSEVLRVEPKNGRETVVAQGLPIQGPEGIEIERAKCAGLVPDVQGTNGKDTITGSLGPDVISGLGGPDRIRGRGGRDILCGGKGRDDLQGQGARDRLLGQGGPDRLAGGGGKDRLKGGGGRDIQLP